MWALAEGARVPIGARATREGVFMPKIQIGAHGSGDANGWRPWRRWHHPSANDLEELGRTVSTLAALHRRSVLDFPHGWKLDLDAGIDGRWHAMVVKWMAEHRRNDNAGDYATYLKRLSILVFTASRALMWPSRDVAYGTAWAILVNGLYTHSFVVTDYVNADRILNPAADFFDTDASSQEALEELLHSCYRHDKENGFPARVALGGDSEAGNPEYAPER